jgi:hypothetical protein
MNNKKNQKSTYTFFGVAIVAIAALALSWLYLEGQPTKVLLSSDKAAYFYIDQIFVDVSVENYKDANEASVIVNYPDNVTLVDTVTTEGVNTRSLDNGVVFEAGDTFFDNSETKFGTLVFESDEGGKLDFTLDEELTNLNSNEGNIEIDELVNINVSVGITSDEINEKKSSTGSALDF